jgi:signal transduction histidine kinase
MEDDELRQKTQNDLDEMERMVRATLDFMRGTENAVRYGRSCEISVDEREDELLIDIRDHGPGIPMEMLEKVFNPFTRLEISRAKHTGGTGLGLGIARNIARAHGGDLMLSNRPEGGLCARLTLPK